MNLTDVINRLETLEQQVAGLLANATPAVNTIATATGNKTVENITTEATTVVTKALPVVATTISDVAAAQATVASTTGTLAKIEEGLTAFLSDAPPLIAAINPAAGAMASGIASGMLALLGLLQDLHTNTTAPAVAAATTAAK